MNETNTDQHLRKKHWDVQMIKDLFDPTDKIRAVGRSEAMAQAWVELAKENPETLIYIMDHAQPYAPHATRYMTSLIEGIIYKLNKELENSFYRARFILTPKINDKIGLIYSYHPDKYR